MKKQVAEDHGQWMQSSHSSLGAENHKLTNKQNNNLHGMTPIPGEKMNLLNLIRANREPSLLTGTTKEFVMGSKTNLIS